MKIYDLYTSDGRLEASGSAVELGEKYFVDEATIREAARDGHKLLREYTVKESGKDTSSRKREKLEAIAKLYKKGIKVSQISAMTGINKSTVWKYLYEMKKEGVLT